MSNKHRFSSQDTVSSKRSRASSAGPTRQRRATPVPYKVSLGRQAFPKQIKNTLKYAQRITLTMDAASQANYVFNANGIYDPDSSGGGHQPLYFDQMAAIYNHYTVLKSRIKVTPIQVSSGSAYTVVVFKADDSSHGITTSTSLALERPESSSLCFSQWANGHAPYVRNTFDAVKTFGPDPMDNDNLQGTSAANPVELLCYIIRVEGFVVGATMDIWVELEYDVIWDELKDMTES